MKTSLLLGIWLVYAMGWSDSFRQLHFRVTVQGVENRDIIKEGLKPSELTYLTIEGSDENFRVEEFEIIHARGKSPLNRGLIRDGNRFNLELFRDQAKPGDRIVIHVKKVTGSDGDVLSKENSILQIPIR